MDWSRFKGSGDLFLPVNFNKILKTYLIGSDDTLFYITVWSIIHLISGICTALFFIQYTKFSVKYGLFTGFIIHSIWEAWQLLITNTPKTLRGYMDMLIDTLLYMLGIMAVYLAN
jgi:hypothetical protein